MKNRPAAGKGRRWKRGLAIAAVVLALAFWGLWQVDMFRQTVRIGFLSWTGGLWKLHGHTETRLVPSPALAQKRQVIVYLPPGYALPANRLRRYPVFYLLHGFPDPGDGWVRFGLAPQLVDKSIVQGDLPPMIVVMPDCHGAIGKFGDGEYLNAPNGHGRQGTRLADYLVHDIPAWTDMTFRTIPTPLARVIGGESTGGYGAVNLGLQHPDVFGSMISLSGYFETDLRHYGGELWGPHPDAERVRAESPLSYARTSRPAWIHQFVYLGNGLQDYHDVRDQSERMGDLLKADGVPYAHHLLPGHHSWDQWRLTLIDGLETVRPRLEEAAKAQAAAAPAESGAVMAEGHRP